MLTTPKWTEIVIKIADFEAKIGSLERRLDAAVALNQDYEGQLAQIQSDIDKFAALDVSRYKTAASFIQNVENVKQNVPWASFLPGVTADFKVEATESDFGDLVSAMKAEGNVSMAIITGGGFTCIRDPSMHELVTTPPEKLWIKPSAN